MKQPRLITALITPFVNNNVDIEGFKENIAYQLENQVEGLLVLGTTAESPSLTSQERRALIQSAVEMAKGKASIMVGTGANSTEVTIALTKEAEELGADTALIISPYYNCPMQEGIYRHFEAVVQSTHIPICVYNHPKRTSVNITVETLKKIASLKNVIGVKEVSGDLSQVALVLNEISFKHPQFFVWAGDDAITLPMMSIGAHGTISVASNLVPEQMAKMIKEASLENFSKAKETFYQLLPLFNALFTETNPIGIKAAMNLCKRPAGHLRLPLTEMTSDHVELLEKVMDELQIMPAMK